MNLYVIHYCGDYCFMYLQIVRADSLESAHDMAKKYVGGNDLYHRSLHYCSFTIDVLTTDGDEGTIYETGYIE